MNIPQNGGYNNGGNNQRGGFNGQPPQGGFGGFGGNRGY